ncbi:MAG TPA: radical SAM protein [Candidatus Eisenbacteria bacterium]|nr:radical SAM protein [Candidatus Eisenbacteria bacterium]
MPRAPTSRPRVLLIGPTALDGAGRPIKQRKLYLPGLTLPMLAAAAPPHVDVRLCFESVHEIPYEEPWDLVALTGMGSGIVGAWRIADRFRARGVPVVIGGIAASLAPAEWTLAHADALVIGEAEEIWAGVVADAVAGRLQSTYRAERVPPIDSLPEPRYDLLDRARLGWWRPVQATRGCPYSCSYCSVTAFHTSGYRIRPVEQVVRDVRLAKRTGTRHIAFIDDNIAVDWDYCRRLWEALIPEKIVWMSQSSLQIAERPDMLALARRSGCRLLSFGIESTSEASLASVGKQWNRPGRYRDAVRAVRAHGIDVSTEMIVGFDGDDATVFERTLRFILDNEISVPRVHILTPIPGTPLFEQLERDGRILHRDFSRYTGGRAVFRPSGIEPDELERGFWEMYARLFTWRSIWKRVRRNPAALGPRMRAFVAGVNLHYRNHLAHGITPGIV